MIYPKRLKRGDTIGLAATGSPVSQDELKQAVAAVKSLGFKVKPADNLTNDLRGYLAGSAAERGKQLNIMFADRKVDGIFCVRGGYGSASVLDFLDFDLIKENPKAFVGFSDVTALHLAFNRICGLVTFHGPMAASNADKDGRYESFTAQGLMRALSGERFYCFENPPERPLEVIRGGIACGRTAGGNLSVVAASIGTAYEADFTDKIIFLEEVNEPPGRVERLVVQLAQSGKFRACCGLLLGRFAGCGGSGRDEDGMVKEIFSDAFRELDKPVMAALQSGHDTPMITLPLGALCRMDAREGRLSFDMAESQKEDMKRGEAVKF